MLASSLNLSAVRAAFPARPLKLSVPGTGIGGWLMVLLVVGIAMGIFGFAGRGLFPDIYDDYRISGTARPIRGHVEGKCTGRLILQACDLTLTYRIGGQSYRRSQHYGLFSMTDHDVMVMVDPDYPERATTDFGLDQLWNRVAFFLGMIGLGFAVLCGAMIMVRNAWRNGRIKAELNNRQLFPTTLPVVKTHDSVVETRKADGSVRKWMLGGKLVPLLLRDAAQQTHVLAVAAAPDGSGVVYPLDRNLKALNLSKAEREAVLNALPA